MSEHECAYWDPSSCAGTIHCPPRCPRFVDREGTPWVVRPADADDHDELVAMYADFAGDQRAQGLPPRKRERIEAWVGDLLADGANLVVVGTDGTIAGHALYVATDDPEPEFAIFVHQAFQGRGLGAELGKHVIATAAAGDREALELVVEPRNHVARSLYAKLGFEHVDEAADDVDPRRLATISMRRPLDDPELGAYRRPPLLREDSVATNHDVAGAD